MRRLLLAICVMCAIFAASTCFADTVNGVLAEERIVNLPNDQGKWYISVVGNARNAQYQTILKWFGQDPALRKLKSQVHFCPVMSNSTIYKTRYSMNVKGLPTVRLQNSQGVVIYEAAGKNLPFTAEGLYGAMANSVMVATQRSPILPWRRNHVHPSPSPDPDVAPDPEPQPIDDGGEPEFDTPLRSLLPPLWLMLTVLVTSAGVGVFCRMESDIH